jgi:hypothetical protein
VEAESVRRLGTDKAKKEWPVETVSPCSKSATPYAIRWSISSGV